MDAVFNQYQTESVRRSNEQKKNCRRNLPKSHQKKFNAFCCDISIFFSVIFVFIAHFESLGVNAIHYFSHSKLHPSPLPHLSKFIFIDPIFLIFIFTDYFSPGLSCPIHSFSHSLRYPSKAVEVTLLSIYFLTGFQTESPNTHHNGPSVRVAFYNGIICANEQYIRHQRRRRRRRRRS